METRSNHVLVGIVTLALVAAVALFTVWITNLGSGEKKEYDIFFKQSVSGLNKGSNVSFSGVPAGTVEKIALWKPDPNFVRVRIKIDKDIPILQGTTASINGVGFTGVSEIQLDGAAKGAPPITEKGPEGVPVIPAKPGGLGELLNNAPQLLERLTTLTERLTELLGDKNQASIAGILANVQKLSGELSTQGPEMRATLEQTRMTIKQAGIAAEQAGNAAEEIGGLANTTNGLLADDAKPLIADLRQTVAAAERSMNNLDQTIAAAKPGIENFSQKTMPEVGLLVRDLRRMSASLNAVATKLDQGGATSILGEPPLPDYKPRK